MAFSAVLNGNLYDITTMSVTLAGTPITRGVFTEFNWSGTLTPGKLMGNSQLPLGYTPGQGEYKGSFKMEISHFDDFAQDIINLGYPQVVGVDFDVTLSYLVNQFGPTAGDNIRTVNLIGVRITDPSENTSGTDAKVMECSCIIHRVEVNGLSILGGVDDSIVF
jgi:hypothetical protein